MRTSRDEAALALGVLKPSSSASKLAPEHRLGQSRFLSENVEEGVRAGDLLLFAALFSFS
jgi:hypothetical protein